MSFPSYRLFGFVCSCKAGEKLFEAKCKETLIACSKYVSLPLGLKYMIMHSLLSPVGEAVGKLGGAELENVGYWCCSSQQRGSMSKWLQLVPASCSVL